MQAQINRGCKSNNEPIIKSKRKLKVVTFRAENGSCYTFEKFCIRYTFQCLLPFLTEYLNGVRVIYDSEMRAALIN